MLPSIYLFIYFIYFGPFTDNLASISNSYGCTNWLTVQGCLIVTKESGL
jgi:hypothetical protein